MSLTSADRMEIHELYARCALAFDSGEAEGFASLFTSDGTFGVAGHDPFRGRDQLVAYVKRRFEEAPGMSHHVSNVVIDETPDGAMGHAYGMILGTEPDGRVSVRNLGTYADRLVRAESGWRFASRSFEARLAEGHVGRELTGPPNAAEA